jgi:Fic family protein
MKNAELQIISIELLEACKLQIKSEVLQTYQTLQDSELSINTFSFYTSVAAVYSSKIEGEDIELDSYVKHKRFGIEFLPDYTRKIDDLYDAYQFAKSSVCNKENILAAHRMLTKHILPETNQGKYRTGNMYVTTPDGKIEYVAAPPHIVQSEMDKFYNDLAVLLNKELSIQEIFFFASLLHLVFVKIHPFDDGNGRTARLIEKWFLAQKLGEKAWLIQSEKNYYQHHQVYYKNLRALGLEYEQLDYSKALPFLMLLPQSIQKNELQ